MSIGILFESLEWSNEHLCELLRSGGVESELINLGGAGLELEGIFRHRLIVNRLFPSAPYRGYGKAFEAAGGVLQAVKERGIPMINSLEAHGYECSKKRSGEVLGKAGIRAPKNYVYFLGSVEREDLKVHPAIEYPCVLKPDCGGRSLYVAIIHNEDELESALKEIPAMPFILQEHV
ncbi:MAG: hypothetical protein GY869_09835, partial [Planctomycetes bacterium]|nr:hypothetical protein [Planctomycetota bacterium]